MIAPAGVRATLVVAVLAPLAVACNAAYGERVHESVHQTLVAGAAPLVRVENVAGSVRVDGWEKPSVDVEATKYGYDAQELRNVAVDVHPDPGGVAIVTRYSGSVRGGGVRYRIFVPAGASLNVQNTAGSVDLAGVRGNVTIETQAGTIGADAGRVADDRTIDLRATTGTITLTIARDSSAKIQASSTVGSFSSDFSEIAQRRENIVGTSGGGTIGAGSALIQLSTTTGAISLRAR